MLRIPIFTDQDGNEIIIPGLWYDSEDASKDPVGFTMDAMMYGVALNLKTEWRDYEPEGDSIPVQYYEAEITHGAFIHGGATIFLIAGPEFEKLDARPH